VTENELREAVLHALRKVAPEVDPSTLAPDVPFRDQLEIDSMDFLNVVIELHSITGVDIPDSEAAKVQTITAMVAYLAAHQPPDP
jgi:acyl carrier protein